MYRVPENDTIYKGMANQFGQEPVNEAPLYIRWGAETFCEFEFFLRSQQYIYQFMSCFAYPF